MPRKQEGDEVSRPGGLERYAVDCALRAASISVHWNFPDPEFCYTDYFEATCKRNLELLEGLEELGEDVERRGIIPQSDSDQARLVTDGGQETYDVTSLEDLESGDTVEFELADRDGVVQATVGCAIVEPPFPPTDVTEASGESQLSGQVQVSLENTETAAKWNLHRELHPDKGLTGPVTASVKACIDVRHPPRYRWQDRGTVESLEVVDRA